MVAILNISISRKQDRIPDLIRVRRRLLSKAVVRAVILNLMGLRNQFWYGICYISTFMISRVENKSLLDLKSSSSQVLPSISQDGRFQAILEKRLESSRTLDAIMIQFLSLTLEKALSDPGSEEDFDSGMLALSPPRLPVLSPQKRVQPYPGAGPGTMTEASKYSQGQQNFEPMIKEASEMEGVDPALIKAVIQVESGGNPMAVSPAGAQGLMQLMPDTAAELGVKDSLDPHQNIQAGTRLVKRLLDRYQGNLRLALAAYNWGSGNLERNPDTLPGETKDFIARVQERYLAFKNSSPSASTL